MAAAASNGWRRTGSRCAAGEGRAVASLGLRGGVDLAAAGCWNSSPTSIRRRSATRRSRITPRRGGSIRWSTRGDAGRRAHAWRRGDRGARVSETVSCAAIASPGVRRPTAGCYEADMVVNCAGRWANDPVSDAGLHLPLAPTVGFLVFTPPVAAGVEPRGALRRSFTRGPTARDVWCCTGTPPTRHWRSIRTRVPRCRRRAIWCSARDSCCR